MPTSVGQTGRNMVNHEETLLTSFLDAYPDLFNV